MLATVSRNLIMRQHVSSINPKMWCSSSPSSLKLPKWSICLTFSSRMTSKIVRAQHQREMTSYSFLLSFTFPAERASSHLIQRLGVMTWKSALIHMYYLLSLQKSLCELASSWMWLDWQGEIGNWQGYKFTKKHNNKENWKRNLKIHFLCCYLDTAKWCIGYIVHTAVAAK